MSALSFLTLQQEVAAQARLDLNQSAQAILVKRWINLTQREVWSRADWMWSRDREIVQTSADKTDGTIDVSVGGTTVTGTSTAFAAGDVGKFIQTSGSDDWYKITAVASSTSLTIEKPYTQTTALDDGTYIIRQLFYSLSSSAEKVLSAKQAISPRKILAVNWREFDVRRPFTTATGEALAYCLWGLDSNKYIQVMLYPYATEIVNLEITIKKKPIDMSADADTSVIPEQWHPVLLKGSIQKALDYARKETADTRPAEKMREYQFDLQAMVDSEEIETDVHSVIQSCETSNESTALPRLPSDFA